MLFFSKPVQSYYFFPKTTKNGKILQFYKKTVNLQKIYSMKSTDIIQKYHLNEGFFGNLHSCFTPISLDDFDFLKISDFEAIRSDWEAVGQDLQDAIDSF